MFVLPPETVKPTVAQLESERGGIIAGIYIENLEGEVTKLRNIVTSAKKWVDEQTKKKEADIGRESK